MKKMVLGLVACSLLFTACKKKKEVQVEEPKPLTKSEMLSNAQWRATASSSEIQSPFGAQTIDLWNTVMQECQKDNLYSFNADHTTIVDEGPSKCNSSDPQSKSAGAWALANNDTQLQGADPVNPVSGNATADILVLDSRTLTLRYVTTINGFTATTTTSYTNVK